MDSLEQKFPVQMNLLKHVCDKFKQNDKNGKELSEMVSQLSRTNKILKENEEKLNLRIKNFYNEANNKAQRINDYLHLEKENEILNNKNKVLENVVNNLEQNIKQIQIENNNAIEKIEVRYSEQEKVLNDHLESLQATIAMEKDENDNEIDHIKQIYEERLKKAKNMEQQLTTKIFNLENQMAAATTVLDKKISELQEKNNQYENNKSSYIPRRSGFMSAQNVLDISDSHSNSSYNNRNYINQLHKSAQVKNTVNINNIEINSARKFQFRKSHNTTKHMLSEKFNPFQMHQQMASATQSSENMSCSKNSCDFQNDSSNTGNNINIINSFDVTNSKNNPKSQDVEETNCYEHNSDNDINTENISTSKTNKNPKRRKLYNPNNMDYLELY